MTQHRKLNNRIDPMIIFTGFIVSAIAQLFSELGY